MEDIRYIEEYYARNGKKLRLVVDKLIRGFGGITQKDYDDFYSLANEVFVDAYRSCDGTRSFDGFLFSCLSKRIKTEITRRNRLKRQADRDAVSLDAPVAEGEETTVGDLIPSDFDMERELDKRNRTEPDNCCKEYIRGLSSVQKEILSLRMEGIPKPEILKLLRLPESIYDRNLAEIRSYDKVRILLKEKRTGTIGEERTLSTTQTSEICKVDKLSVASCIKKLQNYSIRSDHPLQRNSNQWTSLQKYNLITTVLHQYPIPEIILAEQVRRYGTDNWLIDGKQRITNLADFKANLFKIGRSAERPVIEYQAVFKDGNGDIALDENGAPRYENREFDVRGKYYRDLPEELMERFNDFTVSFTQYLSCSDEDIEYHIRRYNASRPMSAAQKGITHLGEQYARVVKTLSQHRFFKDKGNFRVSEFANGTMDRVITESIMTINFMEDWKKRQEDICAYLKENVKINHFNTFENDLDRLAEVITPETAEMFNSKEAFLWFGLFRKFADLELEDEKFISFMLEFKKNLRGRTVDGISYDLLNEKSTKDRGVVQGKLSLMEQLMDEYLHIQKAERLKKFDVKDEKLKRYICEFKEVDLIKMINIKPDADRTRIALQTLMAVCGREDVSDKKIGEFIRDGRINSESIEDTLLYLDSLNDWSLNVDNNSGIFDKKYVPVLVRFVGYIYQNEISEDRAVSFFEHFVRNFDVDGGFPRGNGECFGRLVEKFRRFTDYMDKKQVLSTGPGE